MIFRDRVEAGKKMTTALQKYRGTADVILALPCGGVICAATVAEAFGLPLDLVLTRKITHPHSSEFAIGAVSEHGTLILRGEAALLDQQWLDDEIDRQRNEIKRQRHVYLTNRPSIPLRDKTVVIIDDGVATCLTMEAAIESVSRHKPKKIVVAVPVAPPDAVERLLPKVHDIVALHQPQSFFAVGEYYASFPQVSDREVLRHLQT